MIETLARMYDRTPKKVSVKLKKHPKSVAKACFSNAYDYVTNHSNSSYVLGYAVFNGVPIEHAWVKEGQNYFEITLQNTNNTEYYVLWEYDNAAILDISEVFHVAPTLYHAFKYQKNRSKESK